VVTKLNSPQIEEHWDDLKDAIRAGVGSGVSLSDDELNNMLHKFLRGEGQVWVGMQDSKICLVATTFFVYDMGGEVKHLLIYSLYGYSKIAQEVWNDGRNQLLSFARGSKCGKVTAFTSIPRVLQVAHDVLGGDINTRYIQWEV